MGKIIRFKERVSGAVAKHGAATVKHNVAAFAADAEGQYVFVNGHWSRLAGVSQSGALGQGWLETVHPDDRADVSRSWQSAVRGERYFGLTYRVHNPKLGTRWVLNQAIPQHNDDGELSGFGGTITDLSQFSESHFDPSSETRLRAILDLLGLCYYEQNLVTGEVSCSSSCFDLIHGAQTEQEYDALLHPEDLPEVNRLFNRSIAEGTLFQAEYRIAARDKTWHRVRDYAKIVHTASGTPSYAVGFMAPVEAFREPHETSGVTLLCRLAI